MEARRREMGAAWPQIKRCWLIGLLCHVVQVLLCPPDNRQLVCDGRLLSWAGCGARPVAAHCHTSWPQARHPWT